MYEVLERSHAELYETVGHPIFTLVIVGTLWGPGNVWTLWGPGNVENEDVK